MEKSINKTESTIGQRFLGEKMSKKKFLRTFSKIVASTFIGTGAIFIWGCSDDYSDYGAYGNYSAYAEYINGVGYCNNSGNIYCDAPCQNLTVNACSYCNYLDYCDSLCAVSGCE